jgi:predicted AAA+ superfamily ATPase
MDYDIHGIMEYISTKPGYYFCMIASYMGSLIGEDEYLDSLEVINLMPLTFEEFLIANKAQNLCKYIEKQRVTQVDEVIIQRIIDYLKVFFVVGGMPEIVAEYIKSNDIQGIDKLQKGQLIKYRGYISKKAPKNILEKVLKIWDSIPAQLTKDNRKFMYGYVDEKARAREYESATNWLVDNGLLRRVFKVEKGLVPLKEHIDKKSFELYHLDHGLLRQMKGLNGSKLLARTNLFDAMEGALVEQMVLAELTLNANVKELYFWISGATARIDFLFEDDGEVIPVDVQSTIRTKAQSIKVFQQKYNNRMAIRISLGELNFSKGVLNIPLYGLWNF